jgi:hypothetical protein
VGAQSYPGNSYVPHPAYGVRLPGSKTGAGKVYTGDVGVVMFCASTALFTGKKRTNYNYKINIIIALKNLKK